ncbi:MULTISPECIES: PoNe immunity protein domain-containing protein [unclassified Acinetobacter]|uniref:PoNe immunity protein domain-containing protein n=1 Tax=unclassified Acinetobacter TaxID=196816 RepID=UPI0015D1051B|nr:MULTISPECIES: PoNe immunity protein domain-containing protein [unclassified Acinetobacter]
MLDFTERRRQQFLTEDYYKSAYDFYIEDVDFWKESDTFEDDQYNCGEDRRWTLITHDYSFLLYLVYTAGKSIGEVIPLFEKVIEGFEKQSEALAIFHKSKKPSVIPTQNETLNILGLAFLLNRNDLFDRIHSLVNGEGESHTCEDEIINKFFKLNDPSHPTFNEGNLFALGYSKLCDVIDNVLVKNNKETAVKYLDEYLADWYQMNKNALWFNSHLEPAEELKYCGYWSFEAAALVYLLDLDDSSLHKHLFYPKDIVAWARKNNTQSEVTQENLTVIKVKAGEKSPKTGYWTTPAQEDSRVHVLRGEMLPTLSETDWGEVYWYFNGEE